MRREAEDSRRKKSFKTSRQQGKLVSQFPNQQTPPPQRIPGLMARSMSLVWPSDTPNLKSEWLEEETKKAISFFFIYFFY